MSAIIPHRSVILSGPSVVGKTTFIARLVNEWQYYAPSPITTRPKRSSRNDTDEYRVITTSQMDACLQGNTLIAENALGHVYSYPVHVPFLFTGQSKVCLHALTSLGLRIHEQAIVKPLLVFLKHPSEEILRRRLADVLGAELAEDVREHLLREPDPTT